MDAPAQPARGLPARSSTLAWCSSASPDGRDMPAKRRVRGTQRLTLAMADRHDSGSRNREPNRCGYCWALSGRCGDADRNQRAAQGQAPAEGDACSGDRCRDTRSVPTRKACSSKADGQGQNEREGKRNQEQGGAGQVHGLPPGEFEGGHRSAACGVSLTIARRNLPVQVLDVVPETRRGCSPNNSSGGCEWGTDRNVQGVLGDLLAEHAKRSTNSSV